MFSLLDLLQYELSYRSLPSVLQDHTTDKNDKLIYMEGKIHIDITKVGHSEKV